MRKRFIVSESEKTQILKLYGVSNLFEQTAPAPQTAPAQGQQQPQQQPVSDWSQPKDIPIYGADGKQRMVVKYEPVKVFESTAFFPAGRYSIDSLGAQMSSIRKTIDEAIKYISAINGSKGGLANKGKFAPTITIIGSESNTNNIDREPDSVNFNQRLPPGALARLRATTLYRFTTKYLEPHIPHHLPFDNMGQVNKAVKIGQPIVGGASPQDQNVKFEVRLNPLVDVVSNAPLSMQGKPTTAPK